jgi:hypothetical protein
MEEIWKDINGYEGLYKISSLGRVLSLNYKGSGTEGFIRGRKFKNGYRNVYLTDASENAEDNIYIHRLVADHFVEKSEEDIALERDVVYFKDGNRDNMVASNLGWMTRQEVVEENVKAARHLSKTPKRRYLRPKQVQEMKALLKKKELPSKDIANLYGVSIETVSHVKTGKRRVLV